MNSYRVLIESPEDGRILDGKWPIMVVILMDNEDSLTMRARGLPPVLCLGLLDWARESLLADVMQDNDEPDPLIDE